MKNIFITIILFFVYLFNANTTLADFDVAQTSAMVNREVVEFDERKIILRKFLEKYDSPLTYYSDYFIDYADKYGLDWKLVVSISGVESTFGKRIPFNSYNAYGWANGTYVFDSWDESIEVVTKTLKEKYFDKGLSTPETISRVYAPPSKTWAKNVRYFMNKIEDNTLKYTI